jgi:hypothetical protein
MPDRERMYRDTELCAKTAGFRYDRSETDDSFWSYKYKGVKVEIAPLFYEETLWDNGCAGETSCVL